MEECISPKRYCFDYVEIVFQIIFWGKMEICADDHSFNNVIHCDPTESGVIISI